MPLSKNPKTRKPKKVRLSATKILVFWVFWVFGFLWFSAPGTTLSSKVDSNRYVEAWGREPLADPEISRVRTQPLWPDEAVAQSQRDNASLLFAFLSSSHTYRV